MCGCLWATQVSLLIIRTATGVIPMWAGHGSRIIRGDGLRSTTAAGCSILFTAGFGFPIITGLPPGWCGEVAEDIAAGRQWAPAWALLPLITARARIGHSLTKNI